MLISYFDRQLIPVTKITISKSVCEGRETGDLFEFQEALPGEKPDWQLRSDLGYD